MEPLIEFFRKIFVSDFMPHGHCYFWQPDLVWLHSASDALIVLAYYSIPLVLIYFIRSRPRLRFNGIVLMFGAFMLACGTTHLMNIWNLWHSTYRLEGIIKAITAGLSLATAISCLRLAPETRRMALPDELEHINAELRAEIAARKSAEEKLIQVLKREREVSENTLRSYFESAPHAIVAIGPDGRIQLMNRRTEEMFGYGREELSGQEMDFLIPERFRQAHEKHRQVYFAEPRTRAMGSGMTLLGRRKDGTEFPVEIGLGHVRTDHGPLALGLISDITERVRSEKQLAEANAELRAREQQLRSYLEAASQGIVAISSDGCIEMVNGRIEEMFGYSRQELLGVDVDILLPDRYRTAHAGHRKNYFAEPKMRPMGAGMNLAGRRKDGTEFPVEIGLGHVDGEQGGLALGLVSDITERRRTEAELARVNRELLRSNSELAQFAYVASHDLQEPLRIISGYLQLLERRYKNRLPQEASEFIQYAVDGATRMKGLIEDLLRLSRAGTQAIHLRPVDSGKILDAACANLQFSIQDSRAVLKRGDLPEVVADAGLLTQVFQNLIGNALKFRKKDVQPRISVWADGTGEDWIFSIEDNGIGIEPQHRERVFHIFERLHGSEEYSGSGIGLAICHRILERHSGRIWIEAASGNGSVFRFAIPNRPSTS